jgi:hypothetical protein
MNEKTPENKKDKKADTGTVDSPGRHYSRSARAGQIFQKLGAEK